MDGTGTALSTQDKSTRALADPLATSTWEEVLIFVYLSTLSVSKLVSHYEFTLKQVSPKDTLITPVQCKSLWRQFKSETEYTVTQAISAQVNFIMSVISFLT